MRPLFVLLIICSIAFSCKKSDTNNIPQCAIPAIVPFQPYSDPVWHPNGELLGFNHTPLADIITNGTIPCLWYSYLGKLDSTGFYFMKKDGTGLRRVTNFRLQAPAWSPDGKWLAFSLGANIYKIPFDGIQFDTSQIIKLTTTGGNYFPTWTANSDTIYYDSNAGTSGAGYYIWKMASNGSGKVGFPNTGRQPFVGSDNRVYYIGLHSEIFSISKDGTNTKQITFNSGGAKTPKFWQGKIFYEANSIKLVQPDGTISLLDSPAVTYDISTSGEIVYSKMKYNIMDYYKQIGTLWIMNANGRNKRQITFNSF